MALETRALILEGRWRNKNWRTFCILVPDEGWACYVHVAEYSDEGDPETGPLVAVDWPLHTEFMHSSESAVLSLPDTDTVMGWLDAGADFDSRVPF